MLGRKLRKSGQCTDEGVNAEHVTSGLRCLKWDMDLKCVGSRASEERCMASGFCCAHVVFFLCSTVLYHFKGTFYSCIVFQCEHIRVYILGRHITC